MTVRPIAPRKVEPAQTYGRANAHTAVFGDGRMYEGSRPHHSSARPDVPTLKYKRTAARSPGVANPCTVLHRSSPRRYRDGLCDGRVTFSMRAAKNSFQLLASGETTFSLPFCVSFT